MRPVLKAGLLPVWRNRDTMQIGIDPRRAIALTGMREAARLLALLDGSRDHGQVLAAAMDLGIATETADRALSLLAAGGVLDDFPAAVYRALPASARTRLAPELATAALAHGDSDGGARTLARRRDACVHVRGTSRVGLLIASLLADAGVGTVGCSGPAGVSRCSEAGGAGSGFDPPPDSATAPGPAAHPGPTRPVASPGPSAPAEPGTPSGPAAHPRSATPSRPAASPGPGTPAGQGAHLRRAPSPGPATPPRPAASPGPGTPAGQGAAGRWPPSGPRPDLVILADTTRRDLADALHREGIPHLSACGSEAIGVVGPLVLPGRSACLRCLDLTRTDRDPAWPLILAQLASRAADPPACDTVLAAAVAAQAAAQALVFIDRGRPSAAVTNGTLDVILPDWQWRRRSWQPHNRCGCGSRRAS